MSEFYSCPLLNNMSINFAGKVHCDNSIAFCCEPIEDKPALSFAEDAATTLRNFIDLRLRLLNEGYTNETTYSHGCRKCANYHKKMWPTAHQIHHINLSMYPSPCQCKCFYCDVHDESQAMTPLAKERYEQLFDVLDYAKKCGVIAPNAIWQISCGEITIHPYKDRIMRLTEGQHTIFYTNCFIYDEQIAENLRSNPQSAINLSIDSGTPKTWKKIKGVDNFENVMMNLTKYYVVGNKPGQITLKYIIFPGINDSEEDYICLTEIMNVLNVKHLTISRDTRYKYDQSPEEKQALLNATARLLCHCTLNQISVDMFTYSKEEQQEAIEIAKEIITLQQ